MPCHDLQLRLCVAKCDLAALRVIRALQVLINVTSRKVFNPGQLRIPAGQPGGGEWTTEDSPADGSDSLDDPLQTPSIGDNGEQPQDASRRRVGPTGTPAQEARWRIADAQAREATSRVRELDPAWRDPISITGGVEGEIAHREAVARAAEQRYNEIVKDAIPGANPSWGVNRLRKELYDNGFYFERPTDSSGYLYRNPETGAQVRIMERPSYHWRSDPPEKYYF